ncbi:MAG: hypothetical protein OHK0011_03300 [Turneriella sp.]
MHLTMQKGDPKALEYFNREAFVPAAHSTRCAQTLHVTSEKIESTLDGSANYQAPEKGAESRFRKPLQAAERPLMAVLRAVCGANRGFCSRSGSFSGTCYRAWHDGGSADEKHVWPPDTDA